LANHLTITTQMRGQSRQRRSAGDDETLCFESIVQFFGLITERRWKILALVLSKRELPERQLAQLLGRDEQKVHIDVVTLEGLGLLLRDQADWLSCPYASFHIDIRY
jgi:predicted transcriptional regulator